MKIRNVEKFTHAVSLFDTGKTQKEISSIVGVTDKTIRGWFKPLKLRKEKHDKTIKLLEERLSELVSDPNADVHDINAISWTIERLEKQFLNK